MQLITCPKCQSEKVESRNIGRKTGSALGVAVGVAGALSSFGLVAAVSNGVVLKQLASVVRKAMVNGASGCAAGAALGEVVDVNIFAKHRCLHCGHCFSMDRS